MVLLLLLLELLLLLMVMLLSSPSVLNCRFNMNIAILNISSRSNLSSLQVLSDDDDDNDDAYS